MSGGGAVQAQHQPTPGVDQPQAGAVVVRPACRQGGTAAGVPPDGRHRRGARSRSSTGAGRRPCGPHSASASRECRTGDPGTPTRSGSRRVRGAGKACSTSTSARVWTGHTVEQPVYTKLTSSTLPASGRKVKGLPSWSRRLAPAKLLSKPGSAARAGSVGARPSAARAPQRARRRPSADAEGAGGMAWAMVQGEVYRRFVGTTT